ncbi:MAG: LysM peptidoglycan-binding domain-containing protein [Phycisphaerales bacterium]|nr:LysM peptidoglycan-binding domain-containing protein [Phycisphaerales bacterium]
MRTDVKLGLAVALALTVGAGWYFSRSDTPATQVPLSGSDGVLSMGGGDKSTPPAPATNPSRGNRTNPSTNRPAQADAGRPSPASTAPRSSTSSPATQSAPPPSTTAPGGQPTDSRVASSNPSNAPGAGSVVAPGPAGGDSIGRTAGDGTRGNESTPALTDGRANAPAVSALPMVGNEKPKTSTEVHTSKAGDTFEQLAQLYYGDARYAAAIRSANPSLQPERSLAAGAAVVIPDVQPLPALPRAQPERVAGAVPGGRDGSAPVRGAVPVATNASLPPTPASMKIYTVREGDSLYAIARAELSAGTRWKEIYELNKTVIGGDPAQVKVGQVLKIPSR